MQIRPGMIPRLLKHRNICGNNVLWKIVLADRAAVEM